ncbi:MAG: hypothetical protein JOY90_34045 [Bradyrhizobium sp.]|uniref:hypothetical protein n=1 Tax=Bradyrhizobium sp. TaxID=376 RepID=UPI001D7668E0|nr:hypothetical protein [Bradyrhizobium sp.]MBV9565438.1 hypothetical protein [Bradyrhizobium sp.]
MRVAGIVALMLVAAPVAAQASESCMTQSEARKAFASSHLYWHGANHCWDATPVRRHGPHTIAQRKKERPVAEEIQPPKWRDAMSEMLPPDSSTQAPAAPAPTLMADAATNAPARLNWLDRWVDIVPIERTAPMGTKSDMLGASQAAAPTYASMVTPTALISMFFAIVLTLGLLDLTFRKRVKRRA